MGAYVVKILNPKAKKLLQALADLELISLSEKEAIYMSPEQKETLIVQEADLAYGISGKESDSVSMEEKEDPFLAIVKKLRKKAKSAPPTLEEITQEVEKVRAERYVRKKV